MTLHVEAERLAQYAARVLDLENARLADEYYYAHLPLCVIDAVFSIGIRYAAVQNVVQRYCGAFGLTPFRADRSRLPEASTQETVSGLLGRYEAMARADDLSGASVLAEHVYRNRCRTSPRSGILKSEAVRRFASVLAAHGVEHLQDAAAADKKAIEPEIRRIPGQRSGISLDYFFMLAGSDDRVKLDRMIIRFIEHVLGRAVEREQAHALFRAVVEQLKGDHPHLTPRLLDYAVWEWQRQQPPAPAREHGV